MIARGAAVPFSITVAVAVAVGSCASSSVVSPTVLSSAEIINAGSPALRTLDNTGFVYPGGHTTEVSQGMGPVVVGRGAYLAAPPTTEGAFGLALPLPQVSGRRMGSSSSGPARSETFGRVARALCDHEATCERIGPSGVFESADACSMEQRARLGELDAKLGCETSVSADLLAACLREIRAAQCTVDADALSMPPPCDRALPPCT